MASSLTRALPVASEQYDAETLRYSAATGDATLGELAEWEVPEPFAAEAFMSASGSSERRDFPSK
jgi:hypothetical protein